MNVIHFTRRQADLHALIKPALKNLVCRKCGLQATGVGFKKWYAIYYYYYYYHHHH
jgi:hypothetical protein